MTPGPDRRIDLTARRPSPAGAFDDSPRGRILAATVSVVAHGGYREATVDRILERAHVGWSEFIRQFDDLDACVLATLDAGLESAALRAADAAAACDDDADLETVFEASLRAVLDAAATHPDLTRLCLVDAPALGAPALRRRQIGLQRFVDALERYLEQPGAGGPVAAPGLAAEMAIGGIYEVVAHKVREGQARQLPTLVDELGRLWLPALRA